jgi:mono/diheme cytochrome c family protein
MYPRPRDYRKGTFKFTSTDYGAKPLREDLVLTIRRGIRGTSMPSFELIPKDDREAVVDYVLYLTLRGEFEERLFQIAEVEEALDPEIVQTDGIDLILDKWKSARASVIIPKTVEPEFTAEHVRRGKERFLSNATGCLKCHGEDGRGRTADNLAGNLKDTWGRATRAADLTSGMLHGGQDSLDIYRRIYGGINGTPMPGFANAFRDEPDAIWDLVAYVKYVTNRRRVGESSPPGVIKPYVPVESGQSLPSTEVPAGD